MVGREEGAAVAEARMPLGARGQEQRHWRWRREMSGPDDHGRRPQRAATRQVPDARVAQACTAMLEQDASSTVESVILDATQDETGDLCGCRTREGPGSTRVT